MKLSKILDDRKAQLTEQLAQLHTAGGEELRSFFFKNYSPAAHSFKYEVESEYNDEGGYYYYLSYFSVYDKEGKKLSLMSPEPQEEDPLEDDDLYEIKSDLSDLIPWDIADYGGYTIELG